MKIYKTAVLIILDGWGIGRKDFTNPIFTEKPANIEYIKNNFPSGALQASGIAVGLPWGEEGNSEVGHLTIGSGKILYQNYPRITLAIRDGSFFKNEVIKSVFDYAKKNNSNAHFIGLLTQANVHASLEHLEAIIKMADLENFPKEKVCLHLITDGRDSPPQSATTLISKLNDNSQIASISGRYYTMDRDNHWDRIEPSYKMLIGEGAITDNWRDHIKETYAKNLNDEYVYPTLIGPNKKFIADNDALFFFNFREDRMKEIVKCFIEPNFDKIPVKQFNNLYVSTMIQYDSSFNAPVAFPPEKIEISLSKVLSDNGKIQWRGAETEKYAHITYFFNGLKEEPYPGEFRILVPSRVDVKYDQHPEMRAAEITERLLEAIYEKAYNFILVNFANSDIIAHTGNFEATAKAIKIVDEQIGKIYKAVLETDSVMLITADHGNAERIKNPETGEPETKHDPNPVPIYLVAKEVEAPRSQKEIEEGEKMPVGVLSDISPTILELLGVARPPEMPSQSLVDLLTDR